MLAYQVQGNQGGVLDPAHCRNRTWVLFLQCARSTGDTESGSLEPDEVTVFLFQLQLPVDRAHREGVDLSPAGRQVFSVGGRSGSLFMRSTGQGPGRPGQLQEPSFEVLFCHL